MNALATLSSASNSTSGWITNPSTGGQDMADRNALRGTRNELKALYGDISGLINDYVNAGMNETAREMERLRDRITRTQSRMGANPAAMQREIADIAVDARLKLRQANADARLKGVSAQSEILQHTANVDSNLAQMAQRDWEININREMNERQLAIQRFNANVGARNAAVNRDLAKSNMEINEQRAKAFDWKSPEDYNRMYQLSTPAERARMYNNQQSVVMGNAPKAYQQPGGNWGWQQPQQWNPQYPAPTGPSSKNAAPTMPSSSGSGWLGGNQFLPQLNTAPATAGYSGNGWVGKSTGYKSNLIPNTPGFAHYN